jgi:hypothetical protein
VAAMRARERRRIYIVIALAALVLAALVVLLWPRDGNAAVPGRGALAIPLVAALLHPAAPAGPTGPPSHKPVPILMYHVIHSPPAGVRSAALYVPPPRCLAGRRAPTTRTACRACGSTGARRPTRSWGRSQANAPPPRRVHRSAGRAARSGSVLCASYARRLNRPAAGWPARALDYAAARRTANDGVAMPLAETIPVVNGDPSLGWTRRYWTTSLTRRFLRAMRRPCFR